MNRSPHCLKRFLHHLPHRRPFASTLYNSSVSIFSHLKRLLLRAFRSFSTMDPFSLSLASPSSSALDDDFFAPERTPSPEPETLVLVPFRWWYQANVALDGESEIGGVLFDVKSRLDKKDFFDSDIVLDLKSLDETGTESEEKVVLLGRSSGSGGNDKCLALIAEWMFTRAFKWHNDKKDAEGYVAPSDSIDLLSLQIRVSFVHETSSLYIRINQRVPTPIFAFCFSVLHILFLRSHIHVTTFCSLPLYFWEKCYGMKTCSAEYSLESYEGNFFYTASAFKMKYISICYLGIFMVLVPLFYNVEKRLCESK